MQLISSLIIGLFIGAAADLLMPRANPRGPLMTMLIGAAGSIAAGLVGRAVGLYGGGDTGPDIIASVVGAVLLLGVSSFATRGRAT
jgi:uncharacterized membrane protein YeaQ/YmgE (transglycosylase-associated protein family)